MTQIVRGPYSKQVREVVSVEGRGDASMHAFRSLRDNPGMESEERSKLKRTLFQGKNAIWSWFALRELRDLDTNDRGVLCESIAKSQDGLSMIWALEEPGLTPGQRNLLIDALTRLKLSSWAIYALERVQGFSEMQRERLLRVAQGLDPDST
jgi:hypothetical protein